VKYVLGGSERNVRREFLSKAPHDVIGDNESEGQACVGSGTGASLNVQNRQSRRLSGSPQDKAGATVERMFAFLVAKYSLPKVKTFKKRKSVLISSFSSSDVSSIIYLCCTPGTSQSVPHFRISSRKA